MRKVQPRDVVDDFRSQISDLTTYYSRVSTALAGTANESRDISTLAEQTFVSAATAFEGFLSDLFIAFLNRDPSVFQTHSENRIRQSVQEKYGNWHAGRLTYSAVQHVSVGDLLTIIYPTGWNITFKDAQTLKNRANDWLVPSHRAKVTALTVHDDAIINAVKAIRDFIAHRSRGAKDRMNAELANVDQGPPNEHLGRVENDVHNAGSFLKAVLDGDRRLDLYAERLRQIAQTLRI